MLLLRRKNLSSADLNHQQATLIVFIISSFTDNNTERFNLERTSTKENTPSLYSIVLKTWNIINQCVYRGENDDVSFNGMARMAAISAICFLMSAYFYFLNIAICCFVVLNFLDTC